MCTLAKMHFDAFKRCQSLRGVGGHREAQTILSAHMSLIFPLRRSLRRQKSDPNIDQRWGDNWANKGHFLWFFIAHLFHMTDCKINRIIIWKMAFSEKQIIWINICWTFFCGGKIVFLRSILNHLKIDLNIQFIYKSTKHRFPSPGLVTSVSS